MRIEVPVTLGILFVLVASAVGGMNPAASPPPLYDVVLFGSTYRNNGYSAMCIKCHERNTSISSTDNTGLGSHFVWGGTDNLTRNKDWEKVDAWDTGPLSKYGKSGDTASTTGEQGEMICESCHSMQNPSGYKMLLVADNTETDPSPLCEGCHGTTGGGHHLLTGEISSVHGRALSNSDSDTIRNPPTSGSGVTYPGTNKVNCRSCHKPHDAGTASGARILHRGYKSVSNPGDRVSGRGGDGMERQYDVSPDNVTRLVTDFTPLCDACHKAGQ